MSFARKLELPSPLPSNWQSAWKQNYNGDSFPVLQPPRVHDTSHDMIRLYQRKYKNAEDMDTTETV